MSMSEMATTQKQALDLLFGIREFIIILQIHTLHHKYNQVNTIIVKEYMS